MYTAVVVSSLAAPRVLRFLPCSFLSCPPRYPLISSEDFKGLGRLLTRQQQLVSWAQPFHLGKPRLMLYHVTLPAFRLEASLVTCWEELLVNMLHGDG